MPLWRKTILVTLDITLAVYLVLAITSFNHPNEEGRKCTKVNIQIADENTNGFLSAKEIRTILQRHRLYPWQQPTSQISMRKVEELLKESPFVKTAECYMTQSGDIFISITQRMPVVRIKNEQGNDYYLDDMGREMPNSKYVSDLIIATGNINRRFAREYLAQLAKSINGSDLWRNQIEQINVLPDQGIELVPRIGNHIVYIGHIPKNNILPQRRDEDTDAFVKKKLSRLEKFYKYGLSQAGWNKYSYINIEFDNQIICKRNNLK
ncbi:MAG: cell division protein FtsQ [Prevotella sp.]|nr:cell division protein FtsQ [Prevotella sp.]